MKDFIFFGSTDDSIKRSWGNTNLNLVKTFLDKGYHYDQFDYGIYNRLFNKINHLVIRHFHKTELVLSPLQNELSELKLNMFLNSYKKHFEFGLHSGGICLTRQLLQRARNFLYVDATIVNGLKYGNVRNAKIYIDENKKYFDLYFKRLTAIFTFNQWTKDSLTEDFGYDEKKIYNVGFGANLKPYNGPKDYNNNLLLIVLRRGLEEIKGLNLLLEAFKIAKQNNNRLKLAVVGTTSENIDGVEYYEGYPREKTIELFQQASLYTMPALMESNGMVYPEALSCRTPILGLDRLAFPEFAGYGKYGFIVEKPEAELVANTILSAINDPDRLEQMGTEGQKFAIERYNWDNVVDRMLEIIEKYIK